MLHRLLIVAGFLLAAAAQAVSVGGLRCESRPNPQGIDAAKPRLGWNLDSGRQTAYQVVVEGAWDSGKVDSGQTFNIEYAGKPLASLMRCEWKVRVWDGDGKPSEWSKPAFWTMGLLAPGDWQSEWIGYDKPRNVERPAANLDGAKWIWHAADPQLNAPKCRRVFSGTFALPENAVVDQARLLFVADDGCKAFVNDKPCGTSSSWKEPVQADLQKQLKSGANELRFEVENGEPGPGGLLVKLVVVTADGKTFTQVTDGAWKSAETAGGAMAPVKELGGYGMQPWGKLTTRSVVLPPPVFVRTTFRADKPVARATLCATGLGIFDLHLNGKRVSDDYFSPGWTDYSKRVLYRTCDVTALVAPGENALGAILADGWFSGYVGYGHMRNHYGKSPRVRAQLHLDYADGTTAVIATGPQWKVATGPFREADFLMGEIYDARLALDNWAKPGFDDGKWEAVATGSKEVQPKLVAHAGPPVRVIAEFPAKSITEPKPGAYVLDLGQNFAGVVRLKVTGTPGQTITLRYAERLNPDGTIYTTNLRSARATDIYICRGGGIETWEPRFTFHGFQYIEVTGLAGRPAPDTVVGLALSSDTPVAGAFECSDPMLNQLHSNICWTQRMNFIDIPTDCPQRDERLGWTGDAQVYVRTATLNNDVQAFFAKWLDDLCADGQRADGQFPMVAPIKVAGNDGGPAWADAGVICPWTIYEVYGDRRVLERHYEAMTRFIAFCKNRCTPELLPPAKFHCFGDWLSIKADTPRDVIYLAYFAYSTRLVARTAEALGKTEDAAKYNGLFQQIKAAFNKAYVAADGRIKGNTQCGYVLAIVFDLVDGENAKLAAKYLVDDIEARGNHLSTGFIGTKDLMLALAKAGRNDVAYRLIHNDTFPSWGFSIKHGATSIWERWNGWTPEKGFGDPGMNSFAHYSFGAVYQWMVENIGGIRNGGDAYSRIIIAPQPGGKLTWAKTRYDSIRGRIETAWKLEAGKLTLDVTIPANTTATVIVPGKDGGTHEVGPGTHHFQSSL
jgi:alpha-L-rhamnosidase